MSRQHPALPVQPPLRNRLLSRRRARRGSVQVKTTLPDWVWGAGLGAIVAVFIGGFFFVSNLTGGDGSICDEPLNPIGDAPSADAAGFLEADQGLGRLVSALQSGDLGTANALFFGRPHNFMHIAEPEIRQVDEDLGKQLCEDVIKFESDFDASGFRTDPQVLAQQVITIREFLRDGAEVLGISRPSG